MDQLCERLRFECQGYCITYVHEEEAPPVGGGMGNGGGGGVSLLDILLWLVVARVLAWLGEVPVCLCGCEKGWKTGHEFSKGEGLYKSRKGPGRWEARSDAGG